METYDISISFGIHKVEVVLQQWQYAKTCETHVGGNCKGHSILDAAISNIYYGMEDQEDPDTIVLTAPNGDTLECHDDEGRGEAWLENMVVSLRVLSFEPERPIANATPPSLDTPVSDTPQSSKSPSAVTRNSNPSGE